MSSRDQILAAIKVNQPDQVALPDLSALKAEPVNVLEKYISTLTAIGGKAYQVNNWEEIINAIGTGYKDNDRIITIVPELANVSKEVYQADIAAHSLADVELAVIKAHFAVAENGAVWVTEEQMGHRALPFICQHLAVIVEAQNVVPTMHEAYQLIGDAQASFGTFIAGPSKTADIEQSLVLGAHGPRSMTVFLLNKQA